jgi:hypothetical protein
MRRWWLGLPFCAGNPDTGSRRHRLASAGETIPRGTSTVPTGGKRIPCRSFRTQAGAAADFLTDLSSIGLHPVLVLMLELIPGSSRKALSCGQIIYREIPKGNPMARDSQGAPVALNRFGFGARGGASGDLISAASDPRGFVKAELTRAGHRVARDARPAVDAGARQASVRLSVRAAAGARGSREIISATHDR